MRAIPLILAVVACGSPDPRPLIVVRPDGTSTEIEDCRSACNAPTPDETHLLTEAEYREAVAEVARAPIGQETLGLDTLLFAFEDMPELMARYGTDPLDAAHLDWLRTELSRTTVDVGFRLIDDDGALRGEVQQRIPLKIKQHLVLQGTGSLKRIEVNGKTKRVGLHHLWTRW